MTEKVQAIEFRAELRQIKTMADFTYNVTLNLPDDMCEQVKVLMDWLGDEVGGAMFSVTANPDKPFRRAEKAKG